MANDSIAETAPRTQNDIIHILMPDQTVRSIPFHGRQMSIGRGSENDIVIEGSGISRQHAKIEFDGDGYQVVDLNSTNGVFIDELRLKPETHHPWNPGENLRIGAVWLRIERAEQEISTIAIPSVQPTQKIVKEAPSSISTSSDESQFSTFRGTNQISAFLMDSNLVVVPGKSINAAIVLYNRSLRDDVFYLELQGIPTEWTPNRLQSTHVPANSQKEITITFRPPRVFTSRAGRHSIILRIVSQNDPLQKFELRMALTIIAFSQFTSDLQPKQIRPGETGHLLLSNLGNIPETFSLSWEDRVGELVFDPQKANITVPSGETIEIPYQVKRVHPLWLGGEKINSFYVHISAPSAAAQSHTGAVFSKALIPPWALLTLIFLCLLLSCISFFFVNQLLGDGPDTRATERATQTLGALGKQQTVEAATATAIGIVSANQATIQAITATAVWNEADDDGDGLTNGQESLLKTRPDSRDTDGDGLSDWDEVNVYRTNPLLPDTDGDGLSDGEEIRLGTDPLRKDTDGDGLEDAVDPDPLLTSTPTPQSTLTQTVTPTASATATVTPTATHPSNIADLSVTLTNNTTNSIPGTNTSYILNVNNNSPITVSNVQVIDIFPPILQNVTWNCLASAGSACQYPNGLGNIDARLNLAPSGTATFTISATISPTATGQLSNFVSVNMPPSMTDPDISNNQAIDVDNLTPMVNLSISKTDNRSTVEPAEILTYVIVVNNSGPSAITGLGVTDNFPDSLTNINWECKASVGSVCAAGGVKTGNINTEVGLNPGGNATFTINATVKNSALGVISNTASLSSPINPVINNKSATDTTTIIPKANLKVSVLAPISAPASSLVALIITVKNAGPSNVTGLTLVDELPVNAAFSSSDPDIPACTLLGKTLTCDLGDLAAGQEKEVKIIVIASALTGKMTNAVAVSANQPDPDLTDNQVVTEILIY